MPVCMQTDLEMIVAYAVNMLETQGRRLCKGFFRFRGTWLGNIYSNGEQMTLGSHVCSFDDNTTNWLIGVSAT